jgi:hypothetical protein
MSAKSWASFNQFEFQMPEEAVSDLSGSGSKDQQADFWAERIARPEAVTPESLAKELREYGAWDDNELADDAANWRRILWIAAGNIQEERAS